MNWLDDFEAEEQARRQAEADRENQKRKEAEESGKRAWEEVRNIGIPMAESVLSALKMDPRFSVERVQSGSVLYSYQRASPYGDGSTTEYWQIIYYEPGTLPESSVSPVHRPAYIWCIRMPKPYEPEPTLFLYLTAEFSHGVQFRPLFFTGKQDDRQTATLDESQLQELLKDWFRRTGFGK